jgi:hypothetical protein
VGYISSLVQTARLHDIDPFAFLTGVLERIVSGFTKINELDPLLPWGSKANQITQPAVNTISVEGTRENLFLKFTVWIMKAAPVATGTLWIQKTASKASLARNPVLRSFVCTR